MDDDVIRRERSLERSGYPGWMPLPGSGRSRVSPLVELPGEVGIIVDGTREMVTPCIWTYIESGRWDLFLVVSREGSSKTDSRMDWSGLAIIKEC